MTTFFANSKQKIEPSSSQSLINGNGDSGYIAIATGIIDNALSQNAECNKALISRLFALKPKSLENFSDFADIVQLKNIEKKDNAAHTIATIINQFASALRQIAVDEMVKNPPKYRGGFIKDHDILTPKKLREAGTWVGNSEISALSSALALPVEIRTGEIYRSKRYTPLTPLGSRVVIKNQNDYYFPRVSKPELYRLVNSSSLKPPLIDSENNFDPPIEVILETIEKAEKIIRARQAQIANRLNEMLAHGETNSEKIIEAYIASVEQDSVEEYFINNRSSLSAENPMEQRLINDIAWILANDSTQEEQFFQFMEEAEKSAPSGKLTR